MDINQIINYKKPTENYYDILGCSQSSDADQINKEYKIRALQLHPDKSSDPESVEKFRTLKVAKEVLTDKPTRKLYDAWLNSGINVPFEQFRNKKSHAFHWVNSKQMNKLSILAQNSGSTSDNAADRTSGRPSGGLIDKFRRYEI